MASFALVSDFDGTITRNDFYTLIAERYMGPDAMSLWDSYQAGKITHFEAMQVFFSHAPVDEPSLEILLRDVQADPELPACARLLEKNGWDLIIVSAGCSWYIERILQRTGVAAIVHSNPGEIEPGQGLVMRLPRDSPFFCPMVGIDKKAVVRDALSRYERVIFAGDGPPDLGSALLVDSDNRFARGFLAQELRRLGERFHAFENWSEIVRSLVGGGNR